MIWIYFNTILCSQIKIVSGLNKLDDVDLIIKQSFAMEERQNLNLFDLIILILDGWIKS